MPSRLAAFFGCAVPTGAGMVLCEAKPQATDKIVVVGAGGIGLSVVLAVQALGVSEITVIEQDEGKISYLKKMGIKNIVNAGQKEELNGLMKSKRSYFDYGFDCAGHMKTIQLTFDLVKYQTGKVYFASHPAFGEKIELDPHDLIRGKNIFGSWGGGVRTDRDLPYIFEQLTPFIETLLSLSTNVYELDDINCALADLDCGRVHRPIISMHQK